MKEEFSNYQYYVPGSNHDIVSTSEVIYALETPAGLFVSPRAISSWRKKLLVFAEKFIRKSFGNSLQLVFDGYFSPSWKALLRYLKDENLIYGTHHPFTPLPNDFPKFYAIFFPCQDESSHYAGGCAKDLESALSKAVGELLERQAFLIGGDKRSFFDASAAELASQRKSFIDPARLSQFSASQKNKNQRLIFDENSRFAWVNGKNFSTGEQVLIPAQTIFWNYFKATNSEEPLLREPCTSGAGGFFTRHGAILSGLYELIERDAFLLYWLNSLTPDKVDLNSIVNSETQDLLKKCKQYHLKIHILKLKSDVPVPVFVSIVENLSETGPLYAAGASANLNPEKAILSSLYESLIVYASPVKSDVKLASDFKPFSDSWISRDERVALWKNRSMKDSLDFLIRGKERNLEEFLDSKLNFKDESEELSYLASELKKIGDGCEVYYYEAPQKYLKNVGYRAVKVVVPELIHLYLTESLANLNSKRIAEVPKKIGLTSAKAINIYPHPFP